MCYVKVEKIVEYWGGQIPHVGTLGGIPGLLLVIISDGENLFLVGVYKHVRHRRSTCVSSSLPCVIT